jgi:hypothetical protein
LRMAAAAALVAGGASEGRTAARKLLGDEASRVRLHVALTLARAGESAAVPVLIDLLAVLPAAQVGEVENALQELAGDSTPPVPAGEKPEERKKYRDAWAAWWKANGERIDLGRLTERPLQGYTLICDRENNRIFEIGRDGKERWAIEQVDIPFDAVVLPGQRVLIAEYGANRVTERDFQGKILWSKQVGHPVNVQRLPNGNTFIATFQGPILEVDRAGKDIYTIDKVPGMALAAQRSPRGIICTTMDGRCLLLDTTGKQLRSFPTGTKTHDVGGLDLLPNGHVLVAQYNPGKVVEFDDEGKRVRQWDVPEAWTASPLPNGHILVARATEPKLRELDPAGKIVWEHKGDGSVKYLRARRR